MDLSKEEKYVINTVLCHGWETIYCYFNNISPYNCLAKSIRVPANADTNGMLWICDSCTQKLMHKMRENND